MAEETVEQNGAEAPPKKAGIIGKFLPIALVALLSSAGGGALSAYLISKTFAGAPPADAEAAAEEEVDMAEVLEKSATLGLEPFVVNLADTDAARYLRIQISLMLDDKAHIQEAEENIALQMKVRDVILQTLTQKTSAQLINDEGKNQLREEIRTRIESFFRQPKLIDVMFTEFVIQL